MSLKTPEDAAKDLYRNHWVGLHATPIRLADLIRERDKSVRLALLDELEAEAQADMDHDLMFATRAAVGRLRAKYEAEGRDGQ